MTVRDFGLCLDNGMVIWREKFGGTTLSNRSTSVVEDTVLTPSSLTKVLIAFGGIPRLLRARMVKSLMVN